MTLQLDINPDFQKAFELIENTSRHLFITGKAGSGKSTFLQYACRNSSKNIVVLAPTGVAALNVQGQTVHRFFGFPVNISVEKITSRQFTPRAKRIYQKMQTLIIDEVSMLRADILDCVDAFLRLYGPQTDTPFGGVQMVFVGDLYQLPPVVSNQEQGFFAKRYASPYFFSATVFKAIPLEVIELNKIYRQTDQQFIELLNRIRGNQVLESDIALLNSRLGTNSADSAASGFRISLTTTNQLADSINRRKLEALDGRSHISQAVVDGSFSPDYYPTAEQLEFKSGAQIMFLNNDAKNRWVNGSVGHIEDIRFSEEKIKFVRVRLQDGQRLVDVFPYTWEIYKFALEGREIISEVIGSYTQFPFRLAWAVTIHKSQGKTFDNIEIDLGSGTFATGQLYVALSRCTSFEGISLTKPVQRRHVLTDERIIDFMRQYCPFEFVVPQARDSFLQQAIIGRRKLRIIYQKPSGQESTRVIVPLHLKNGTLLAFCTQRQEQRSFTLERIKTIQNVIE